MTTNKYRENHDVHDHYLVKINTAVAEGRESLIVSLIGEYEKLDREQSAPVDQAA